MPGVNPTTSDYDSAVRQFPTTMVSHFVHTFATLVEQVGHQTHHQSEVSFTPGWKYLGTVKM